MSKTHENRRKQHVAQLAKQNTKNSDEGAGLVQQYRIIRDDLVKLRDDINKGYGMAREAVEKKTIFSELLKLRNQF